MARVRAVDVIVVCLLTYVALHLTPKPPREPTSEGLLDNVQDRARHVPCDGATPSQQDGISANARDSMCKWATATLPTPSNYVDSLVREARAYEASPKYQHKIDEMLGKRKYLACSNRVIAANHS